MLAVNPMNSWFSAGSQISSTLGNCYTAAAEKINIISLGKMTPVKKCSRFLCGHA